MSDLYDLDPDDKNNGSLDGASGPADEFDSSPPPTFAEKYADKIEAAEETETGDLGARVQKLEQMTKQLSEVILALSERSGMK